MTTADNALENTLIQELRIMEKTNSADSPAFVKLLNELGFIYEERCEYAQAEQVYRRSAKVMLGINDESSNTQTLRIKTICNFGRILLVQRKHAKAERVFFRALVAADRAFGPSHIEFARVLQYLGLLYEKMGQFNNAGTLYRKAFTIIESELGSECAEAAA